VPPLFKRKFMTRSNPGKLSILHIKARSEFIDDANAENTVFALGRGLTLCDLDLIAGECMA
jgi:hypothetical protein